MQQKAIIIGAGPAGLTAAYELLSKSSILPAVYEMSSSIGGISKTIRYKNNRIDIGGHRFFSKHRNIMEFWQNLFPIQGKPAIDDLLLNRTNPLPKTGKEKFIGETFPREVPAPDPEKEDRVMLLRNRVSRIFYSRKFFDYPLTINLKTIMSLGIIRLIRIGISYLLIRLNPRKKERTLEDFFINRFGKVLYRTFFKDYTEKVWGVPCSEIGADWGSQRIKGLSITKALQEAVKKIFRTRTERINQKNVETSLIEMFLYPKYGPGQFWEETARQITLAGGEVQLNKTAVGLLTNGFAITGVIFEDTLTKKQEIVKGDYFFSTMPVRELMDCLRYPVPEDVLRVSRGLIYRDFITVGLLCKRLTLRNQSGIKTLNNIIPDNWIYIQESDVRIGRLQIFNNWSPYLVENRENIWIGLEYFCTENDELWNLSEDDFIKMAVSEMEKLGMLNRQDVLDSVQIKVKKAYPAYLNTYKDFSIIRAFIDQFSNLFLIGRNGMHRYNNMDHSMLSAMEAAANICGNITSKDNIWNVNTEQDFHEQKSKIPS